MQPSDTSKPTATTTTSSTFTKVPPAALAAGSSPKDVGDVEAGSRATTEERKAGYKGGVPQSAVVSGAQAQRVRDALKKNPLPIFFRFMAFAASCVAFSLVASTGTKETTINGVFQRGYKYHQYKTLSFVVASNVILFFYSFWMLVANSLVASGRFKPTVVSRRVMSFTVLVLDFTLIFLQFGAATACAGLRGGFSDLGLANYCSISKIFCRKLVAATVMSYIAWAALVPSLYVNLLENEEGPW